MLKITGGSFCGRLIYSPKNALTRPTQARLRQALFNSLQAHLPGARVLDLFAGGGALGLEALSRGAAECVFVEKNRQNTQLIRKNAEILGVQTQTEIFCSRVENCVELVSEAAFDLVLADPPYEEGWEKKLFKILPFEKLLTPQGHLCLEWSKLKGTALPEPGSARLKKVREKNYGDSVLTTYCVSAL